MADILFSNETMQYIKMASRITGADIIDCIVSNDKLIFIVKKGQLGVALGVKARNLERLRKNFKKNVKFVEFDPDIEKFILNLCRPYKIKKITLDGEGDSVVAKLEVNVSDKSRLIGKNGRNIDVIRQLARRHHSVKDVQVA